MDVFISLFVDLLKNPIINLKLNTFIIIIKCIYNYENALKNNLPKVNKIAIYNPTK